MTGGKTEGVVSAADGWVRAYGAFHVWRVAAASFPRACRACASGEGSDGVSQRPWCAREAERKSGGGSLRVQHT